MSTFVVPFLAAFAAAVAATLMIRPVAMRLGAVAHPKDDRWHRKPVPLLGGVAVWAGVLLTVAFAGRLDQPSLIVLGAASVMFVTGLIDDFVQLKPITKISLQIAVACVAVYLGNRLDWTPSPTFNALFSIFWIVGVMNAFNLLDNMDGLCAGVAAIAAVGFCASVGASGGDGVLLLATALAGAAAGFLIFNFNPASVFMGDSGSLFIGCALGMLSLASDAAAQKGIVSALAVPVLLLLIPIFDTTFVTVARKLSARAASVGGRDHTSHRLVAMGFSERHAVLLLYALAALGALTAVAVARLQIREANIFLGLLLIGIILLGVQLAKVKLYGGEDFSLLLDRPYTPLLVEITYKRRMFEVILDVCLIALAYYTSYVLRFVDDFSTYYPLFVESLPIVIACQLLGLFAAGVYKGVWRYFSPYDVFTYVKGIAFGAVTSVLTLVYVYRFEGYSRGVFLINGMALMLLLIASRLSFRVFGEMARRDRPSGQRALIYGAGDGGALVLRELRGNSRFAYDPVGFVDDDPGKYHRRMLGLPVLGGFDRLESIIAEHRPDVIVLSTSKLPAERLVRLGEICYSSGTLLLQLQLRFEPLTMPGASTRA